jgi:hypothetical protein
MIHHSSFSLHDEVTAFLLASNEVVDLVDLVIIVELWMNSSLIYDLWISALINVLFKIHVIRLVFGSWVKIDTHSLLILSWQSYFGRHRSMMFKFLILLKITLRKSKILWSGGFGSLPSILRSVLSKFHLWLCKQLRSSFAWLDSGALGYSHLRESLLLHRFLIYNSLASECSAWRTFFMF